MSWPSTEAKLGQIKYRWSFGIVEFLTRNSSLCTILFHYVIEVYCLKFFESFWLSKTMPSNQSNYEMISLNVEIWISKLTQKHYVHPFQNEETSTVESILIQISLDLGYIHKVFKLSQGETKLLSNYTCDELRSNDVKEAAGLTRLIYKIN